MLEVKAVLADGNLWLLAQNAVHNVSNHLQLHLGLCLFEVIIVLLNLGKHNCFSCTSPRVGRIQAQIPKAVLASAQQDIQLCAAPPVCCRKNRQLTA